MYENITYFLSKPGLVASSHAFDTVDRSNATAKALTISQFCKIPRFRHFLLLLLFIIIITIIVITVIIVIRKIIFTWKNVHVFVSF